FVVREGGKNSFMNFETRSSQVVIERGGSFSGHWRAAPGREKGNKISFITELEQTDGKAMINSIKNGDQPLPRVTQVSIAGTTSTEQPPLKDKSMCNKTAKDLWDALARHMLGSEYGEQDRKAAVLYEYETFKAT
nr:hypothetical protein [Tanacetum cinerariifolium]